MGPVKYCPVTLCGNRVRLLKKHIHLGDALKALCRRESVYAHLNVDRYVSKQRLVKVVKKVRPKALEDVNEWLAQFRDRGQKRAREQQQDQDSFEPDNNSNDDPEYQAHPEYYYNNEEYYDTEIPIISHKDRCNAVTLASSLLSALGSIDPGDNNHNLKVRINAQIHNALRVIETFTPVTATEARAVEDPFVDELGPLVDVYTYARQCGLILDRAQALRVGREASRYYRRRYGVTPPKRPRYTNTGHVQGVPEYVPVNVYPETRVADVLDPILGKILEK